MNYMDSKLMTKRIVPTLKGLLLYSFEESIKIGISVYHYSKSFINTFLYLF